MSAEAETYSREAMALPAGPIESDRLLLRPLTLDDVETLVQMDSDPAVMEFITGYLVAPEDIDDHRQTLRRDIAGGIRFKFSLGVAFREKPDDALGWVILRPTEDGRWIEIGYRLAKRVWVPGHRPRSLTVVAEDRLRRLGGDRSHDRHRSRQP